MSAADPVPTPPGPESRVPSRDAAQKSPVHHDVIVVGAGLIGLATARALQERGVGQVAVLEGEARPGLHQSGRNSGVIHSGLYYRPGSSKARNCARGRKAMYGFCRTEELPHRRTGKLVVATRDEELPTLELLAERGRENGLKGLRFLGPAEMRELEPNVAGIRALRVEEAGIADFGAVARRLAERVAEAGGALLTGHRVAGVRGGEVETTGGSVRGAFLVSCAGLHGHRVAQMEGLDPPARIVPFRGEYREVLPPGRDLVRGLIYPVPDPELPFLGIHVHRTVDGGAEAGPNAVLATHPEGYRRRDLSPAMLLELAAWPGFWRMGLRHGRHALGEMLRSLSPRLFLAELRRLVPALEPSHLGQARSGVRAQAVDRQGSLVDDFLFGEGDRSVHVLNAPSPGATACLAIGEEIAGRVVARMGGDG
jgi:(S)-2-hydroxyglutarate dehydrogenase